MYELPFLVPEEASTSQCRLSYDNSMVMSNNSKDDTFIHDIFVSKMKEPVFAKGNCQSGYVTYNPN